MAGRHTPEPQKEQGLPVNLDAERLVLGSILLDDKQFSSASASLEHDDFSLEKHRRIFRRMADIHARGEAIDRITLANELIRNNELEACDGLGYLVSLDDGLPKVVNLDDYIRIVKQKSSLRRIIFSSQHTMQRAMEGNEDPGALIQGASRSLASIDIRLHASELLNPMQVMESHKGGVSGFLHRPIEPGIPFGWPQLDELIPGLQPQCQYIIAGSPGSGKSAFAENLGISLAKRGVPVAFFSLEMDRDLMMIRAVCAEAEVPWRAYLKGDLMRDQRNAVANALRRIKDIPFYVDDNPAMTITELAHKVDRAVLEKQVRVYFVDYIQILNWRGDRSLRLEREYDAITLASRSCWMSARRNNISSVVLSQLNRPGGKRKASDRPNLEDLKASGGLEADAFAVVMLYREELFFPGRPDLKEKAEALVRKARMGERGTAHLTFKGRYLRFYDDGPPADGGGE